MLGASRFGGIVGIRVDRARSRSAVRALVGVPS